MIENNNIVINYTAGFESLVGGNIIFEIKNGVTSYSYIYDEDDNVVEFSIELASSISTTIKVFYRNLDTGTGGEAFTISGIHNTISSTIIVRVSMPNESLYVHVPEQFRRATEESTVHLGKSILSGGEKDYVTKNSYENSIRDENEGPYLDKVGQLKIDYEKNYKIYTGLTIYCKVLSSSSSNNYHILDNSSTNNKTYYFYGECTYDLYDSEKNLVKSGLKDYTRNFQFEKCSGSLPGELVVRNPNTDADEDASYKEKIYARLFYIDLDETINSIISTNYVILEKYETAIITTTDGTKTYYENGYPLYIVPSQKDSTIFFEASLGFRSGKTVEDWTEFTLCNEYREYFKAEYKVSKGSSYISIRITALKENNDTENPWRPYNFRILPILNTSQIVIEDEEGNGRIRKLNFYLIQRSSSLDIIPQRYDNSNRLIDLEKQENIVIKDYAPISSAYVLPIDIDNDGSSVLRSSRVHLRIPSLDAPDEAWEISENFKENIQTDSDNYLREYFFDKLTGDSLNEDIVLFTQVRGDESDKFLDPDFTVRTQALETDNWRVAIYQSSCIIVPQVSPQTFRVGGFERAISSSTIYTYDTGNRLYLFELGKSQDNASYDSSENWFKVKTLRTLASTINPESRIRSAIFHINGVDYPIEWRTGVNDPPDSSIIYSPESNYLNERTQTLIVTRTESNDEDTPIDYGLKCRLRIVRRSGDVNAEDLEISLRFDDETAYDSNTMRKGIDLIGSLNSAIQLKIIYKDSTSEYTSEFMETFYCAFLKDTPLKLLDGANRLHEVGETITISPQKDELTGKYAGIPYNIYNSLGIEDSDYSSWEVFENSTNQFSFDYENENSTDYINSTLTFDSSLKNLLVTCKNDGSNSDLISLYKSSTNGEKNWKYFIYNRHPSRYIFGHHSKSTNIILKKQENGDDLLDELVISKIGIYKIFVEVSGGNQDSVLTLQFPNNSNFKHKLYVPKNINDINWGDGGNYRSSFGNNISELSEDAISLGSSNLNDGNIGQGSYVVYLFYFGEIDINKTSDKGTLNFSYNNETTSLDISLGETGPLQLQEENIFLGQYNSVTATEPAYIKFLGEDSNTENNIWGDEAVGNFNKNVVIFPNKSGYNGYLRLGLKKGGEIDYGLTDFPYLITAEGKLITIENTPRITCPDSEILEENTQYLIGSYTQNDVRISLIQGLKNLKVEGNFEGFSENYYTRNNGNDQITNKNILYDEVILSTPNLRNSSVNLNLFLLRKINRTSDFNISLSNTSSSSLHSYCPDEERFADPSSFLEDYANHIKKNGETQGNLDFGISVLGHISGKTTERKLKVNTPSYFKILENCSSTEPLFSTSQVTTAQTGYPFELRGFSNANNENTLKIGTNNTPSTLVGSDQYSGNVADYLRKTEAFLNCLSNVGDGDTNITNYPALALGKFVVGGKVDPEMLYSSLGGTGDLGENSEFERYCQSILEYASGDTISSYPFIVDYAMNYDITWTDLDILPTKPTESDYLIIYIPSTKLSQNNTITLWARGSDYEYDPGYNDILRQHTNCDYRVDRKYRFIKSCKWKPTEEDDSHYSTFTEEEEEFIARIAVEKSDLNGNHWELVDETDENQQPIKLLGCVKWKGTINFSGDKKDVSIKITFNNIEDSLDVLNDTAIEDAFGTEVKETVYNQETEENEDVLVPKEVYRSEEVYGIGNTTINSTWPRIRLGWNDLELTEGNIISTRAEIKHKRAHKDSYADDFNGGEYGDPWTLLSGNYDSYQINGINEKYLSCITGKVFGLQLSINNNTTEIKPNSGKEKFFQCGYNYGALIIAPVQQYLIDAGQIIDCTQFGLSNSYEEETVNTETYYSNLHASYGGVNYSLIETQQALFNNLINNNDQTILGVSTSTFGGFSTGTSLSGNPTTTGHSGDITYYAGGEEWQEMPATMYEETGLCTLYNFIIMGPSESEGKDWHYLQGEEEGYHRLFNIELFIGENNPLSEGKEKTEFLLDYFKENLLDNEYFSTIDLRLWEENTKSNVPIFPLILSTNHYQDSKVSSGGISCFSDKFFELSEDILKEKPVIDNIGEYYNDSNLKDIYPKCRGAATNCLLNPEIFRQISNHFLSEDLIRGNDQWSYIDNYNYGCNKSSSIDWNIATLSEGQRRFIPTNAGTKTRSLMEEGQPETIRQQIYTTDFDYSLASFNEWDNNVKKTGDLFNSPWYFPIFPKYTLGSITDIINSSTKYRYGKTNPYKIEELTLYGFYVYQHDYIFNNYIIPIKAPLTVNLEYTDEVFEDDGNITEIFRDYIHNPIYLLSRPHIHPGYEQESDSKSLYRYFWRDSSNPSSNNTNTSFSYPLKKFTDVDNLGKFLKRFYNLNYPKENWNGEWERNDVFLGADLSIHYLRDLDNRTGSTYYQDFMKYPDPSDCHKLWNHNPVYELLNSNPTSNFLSSLDLYDDLWKNIILLTNHRDTNYYTNDNHDYVESNNNRYYYLADVYTHGSYTTFNNLRRGVNKIIYDVYYLLNLSWNNDGQAIGAWNSGQNYGRGSIVHHASSSGTYFYISIKENNKNNAPNNSPDWWIGKDEIPYNEDDPNKIYIERINRIINFWNKWAKDTGKILKNIYDNAPEALITDPGKTDYFDDRYGVLIELYTKFISRFRFNSNEREDKDASWYDYNNLESTTSDTILLDSSVAMGAPVGEYLMNISIGNSRFKDSIEKTRQLIRNMVAFVNDNTNTTARDACWALIFNGESLNNNTWNDKINDIEINDSGDYDNYQLNNPKHVIEVLNHIISDMRCGDFLEGCPINIDEDSDNVIDYPIINRLTTPNRIEKVTGTYPYYVDETDDSGSGKYIHSKLLISDFYRKYLPETTTALSKLVDYWDDVKSDLNSYTNSNLVIKEIDELQ